MLFESGVPEELVEAVRTHIVESMPDPTEVWSSAAEDEDCLTAEVGSALRIGWQERAGWRWRVTYRKFRGRGHNADEKIIGADGIFQVQLERKGRIDSKGLLFQAKKRGNRKRAELLEQCRKMEELAPNASAVWEYSRHGVVARDASEVISTSSLRTDSRAARRRPSPDETRGPANEDHVDEEIGYLPSIDGRTARKVTHPPLGK